jgi:hypothetical protein
VSSDGKWSADNVRVGQPDENGLIATIYAIVATEAASVEFKEYFEEHTTDFPGLPQLPNGATITHSITVTRK